jgi:hypothetical protein
LLVLSHCWTLAPSHPRGGTRVLPRTSLFLHILTCPPLLHHHHHQCADPSPAPWPARRAAECEWPAGAPTMVLPSPNLRTAPIPLPSESERAMVAGLPASQPQPDAIPLQGGGHGRKPSSLPCSA